MPELGHDVLGIPSFSQLVRNEKQWKGRGEEGGEVHHGLEPPEDAEGTLQVAPPIPCLGQPRWGEADRSLITHVHHLE